MSSESENNPVRSDKTEKEVESAKNNGKTDKNDPLNCEFFLLLKLHCLTMKLFLIYFKFFSNF